jgi:hypothetical protein
MKKGCFFPRFFTRKGLPEFRRFGLYLGQKISPRKNEAPLLAP